MNSEVLVKVPWIDVAVIVARLIKFSKGGISKDEAKELVSLLSVLGTEVATALELLEEDSVSVPKKKRKK